MTNTTWDEIKPLVLEVIEDDKTPVLRRLWLAFIYDVMEWIESADERRMLRIMRDLRHK